MTKDMEMEIDARALSEALDDDNFTNEIKWKTLKKKEKEINSFKDFSFLYKMELPKEKETVPVVNPFVGLAERQTPAKEEKNEHAGFTGFIKDHPILSIIAGTALAYGAMLLYKHFSEKKADSFSFKRRLKRKQEKTQVEALGVADKKSKISLSENLENEEPKAEEKTEDKSLTTGEAVISTIVGTVAGAALGDLSLVAAVPVAVYGIKKSYRRMTLAAAGMAIASGYQTQNIEGESFFQRIFRRIKTFFGNLIDKIFFFEEKEAKVPDGFHKTLLGLIPINT